jgi:protein transport protein SEC61 subunit gamma-like protein
MDAVDSVVDPLREFAKDSVRLVKRCHKPDRKGRSPARIRRGGGRSFGPDLIDVRFVR